MEFDFQAYMTIAIAIMLLCVYNVSVRINSVLQNLTVQYRRSNHCDNKTLRNDNSLESMMTGIQQGYRHISPIEIKR